MEGCKLIELREGVFLKEQDRRKARRYGRSSCEILSQYDRAGRYVFQYSEEGICMPFYFGEEVRCISFQFGEERRCDLCFPSSPRSKQLNAYSVYVQCT